MNIYVGSLSFEATEEDVKQTFEAFGKVEKVTIIKDKMTGRPRGFAFVEMPDNTEAQAALTGTNGKEVKGRPISVSEARPRPAGGGGGRGFGGGGGRGFGGGGGRGFGGGGRDRRDDRDRW